MRVTRTDFLGLDKMSHDELEEFAAELADYNAELQETLQRRTEQFEGMAEMWVERGVENFKLRELCADMVKMLLLACWASAESDEEASRCIYRAEALGVEVTS